MNSLQSIRKSRNISQRSLAEKAGITNVTISNLEAGRFRPKPKTRGKIEVALGCPVDWQKTELQGIINKKTT